MILKWIELLLNEDQINLELKIKSLPDKPGVYIFKNIKDKIIYIGKANSLKKRVSSYFTKNAREKKVNDIKRLTRKIETILTSTESEALVLENSLIKLYKPKLNIRLRDDKTYPFLYLSMKEEYPRIEIIRKRTDKEGLYFGPFTDIKSLKIVLRKILSIFPIASCGKDITSIKFERPCLYYQLKRCTAPCVGKISKKNYKENVKKLIKFFEGKYNQIINELKQEMGIASNKLDYEKAALIRDKIVALEKIMQKQVVFSKNQEAEYDVIGIAVKENNSIIQILSMREGRIVEHKHFNLDIPIKSTESEILGSFIKMYYSQNSYIPTRILVPLEIRDNFIINEWLRSINKNKIENKIITIPINEEENNLINLAKENAETKLKSFIVAEELKQKRTEKALEELKEVLKLDELPNRIEGYDISTIQGTNTVGSCVVFQNGKANKNSYRKFTIKTVLKQDDFASMKEVIRRRFSGQLAKKDPLPDLILIDGGLGQVNIAKAALEELNKDIPIIGLAKEFEEIYFPGTSEPLRLDERSEGLRMLQRIRDEAHRFAVSFHKSKRSKGMLKSSLERIPNLGPKRIEKLLNHFNTIEKIKQASIEELQDCEGISDKIALEIYNYYKETIFEH